MQGRLACVCNYFLTISMQMPLHYSIAERVSVEFVFSIGRMHLECNDLICLPVLLIDFKSFQRRAETKTRAWTARNVRLSGRRCFACIRAPATVRVCNSALRNWGNHTPFYFYSSTRHCIALGSHDDATTQNLSRIDIRGVPFPILFYCRDQGNMNDCGAIQAPPRNCADKSPSDMTEEA